MKGHIGVVSDTVGYYYAMDGSARNWAHRPLADNGWTKVIKLKDIDYSDKVDTKNNPNIIYALKRKSTGTWYPAVTNNSDYAGNDNEKFIGFMAKMSDGTPLKYRVHLMSGKWLDWTTGYDKKDMVNGYAGNDKGVIDAIQIKCDKYSINYCSSSTKNGDKYYPTINDADKDYVGVFGNPLDKIMCWVVD